MAQTGYTPIQLYYSTTASTAPLAANLANGELAINITDGKLFYKDNANAVQVIGWKTVPTSAGGTGLTSYTAGDLLYYASGTTLTKLGIGAANTVLTSSGSAPQWSTNLNIGSLTATSISDSGNLTFTGTGNRITGDFTNATVANRAAFQTSTTNSSTGIYALPNGTNTAASWQATNNSDPTNASKILIATNGSTDVQLVSGINGTGTYLPLSFYTNGSERMRIFTSGGVSIGNTTNPGAGNLLVTGSVLVNAVAGIGYATGAGGTVTQATNKTTTVTLDKPTGKIIMNNATLNAGAAVTFQVNNSLVSNTDTVLVSSDTTVNYDYVFTTYVGTGSFVIRVKNDGASNRSEAVPILFTVIKGVTS